MSKASDPKVHTGHRESVVIEHGSTLIEATTWINSEGFDLVLTEGRNRTMVSMTHAEWSAVQMAVSRLDLGVSRG